MNSGSKEEPWQERRNLEAKLHEENPGDQTVGGSVNVIHTTAVVADLSDIWLQSGGDSFVFHGVLERGGKLEKMQARST